MSLADRKPGVFSGRMESGKICNESLSASVIVSVLAIADPRSKVARASEPKTLLIGLQYRENPYTGV